MGGTDQAISAECAVTPAKSKWALATFQCNCRESRAHSRPLWIVLALAVPIVLKSSYGLADLIFINSVQDLENISNNLSGDYVLAKDIDASATVNWNNGAGFVPIGVSSNGSLLGNFSGTFDGQGHVITGLTLVNTTTFNPPISSAAAGTVSMFLGNTGTIKNVSLAQERITGVAQNDTWNGGGLVGSNQGIISRVSVTGAVTNLNTSGGWLGGIAGVNSGSISKSSADVTMSGLFYNQAGTVGGIAGLNRGQISDTYSRGSIANSVVENAGGLVGGNFGGSISTSYATGALPTTANSWGGGS